LPRRNRTALWSRSATYGFIAIVTSTVLTAVGLELALRTYHGKLLDFTSVTHASIPNAPAQYDPLLGWVPRPGRFDRETWSWNANEASLRSNGRTAPPTARPIVAVGDSFTFGDEVDDHETWPAQLERIRQHSVLNAGVFGYGLDQAYLRAVTLMESSNPGGVVLAFISNDITRTQLSYYQRRGKPYFAHGASGLELRNVPVPEERVASRPFPFVNRLLGYSHLASAVFNRTPLQAWYFGPDEVREHTDGDRVSVELLTRLSELGRGRHVPVLIVTFATDGRIGGNRGLSGIVPRLRQNGVQVVDLAAEMLSMTESEFRRAFRDKGHYGPEMNAWVARRLAEVLENGDVGRTR
jgi:hypothetical protein